MPPLPILQIVVNVLVVAVFLIVVGHLLVTQCASRKLYRDLLPQIVKNTEKPLNRLDDLLFTLLGKYRDQNDKEIIDQLHEKLDLVGIALLDRKPQKSSIDS
jgi:hypothetical protein